jgi:clan AA aspartic protease
VIGTVDEKGRALLEVSVSSSAQAAVSTVTAWIDTAFDGFFVFPRKLIQDLKLNVAAETEAILADGTKVSLQTYVCFAEWFGKRVRVEVIANDGRLPLLGTALLTDRILHIDYPAKTLTVD